jgi:hypothetical protein
MKKRITLTEDEICLAINQYVHAKVGEVGQWQTSVSLSYANGEFRAVATIEPLTEDNRQNASAEATAALVTDTNGNRGIIPIGGSR